MVVLSLMLVTMAFFKEPKDCCLKKATYIRKKDDNVKVNLKLYTKNLCETEQQQIKEIICRGEYNNILDIVDNFKVISKNK